MERVLQLLDVLDDYLGPALAFVSFVQLSFAIATVLVLLALGLAGVPLTILAGMALLALPAAQVISAGMRAVRARLPAPARTPARGRIVNAP